MIKVFESSTRDGIEIKFNSIEDLLKYISDDKVVKNWDKDNSEVYLRVVSEDTVTTSISITIDRFSPENDLQVSITYGKDTYGPETFSDYTKVVKWIRSKLKKIK